MIASCSASWCVHLLSGFMNFICDASCKATAPIYLWHHYWTRRRFRKQIPDRRDLAPQRETEKQQAQTAATAIRNSKQKQQQAQTAEASTSTSSKPKQRQAQTAESTGSKSDPKQQQQQAQRAAGIRSKHRQQQQQQQHKQQQHKQQQ